MRSLTTVTMTHESTKVDILIFAQKNSHRLFPCDLTSAIDLGDQSGTYCLEPAPITKLPPNLSRPVQPALLVHLNMGKIDKPKPVTHHG